MTSRQISIGSAAPCPARSSNRNNLLMEFKQGNMIISQHRLFISKVHDWLKTHFCYAFGTEWGHWLQLLYLTAQEPLIETSDSFGFEEALANVKRASKLVFHWCYSQAVALKSQWKFGFGCFAAARWRRCQKRGGASFSSAKTSQIIGEAILSIINLDQLFQKKQWMLRPAKINIVWFNKTQKPQCKTYYLWSWTSKQHRGHNDQEFSGLGMSLTTISQTIRMHQEMVQGWVLKFCLLTLLLSSLFTVLVAQTADIHTLADSFSCIELGAATTWCHTQVY